MIPKHILVQGDHGLSCRRLSDLLGLGGHMSDIRCGLCYMLHRSQLLLKVLLGADGHAAPLPPQRHLVGLGLTRRKVRGSDSPINNTLLCVFGTGMPSCWFVVRFSWMQLCFEVGWRLLLLCLLLPSVISLEEHTIIICAFHYKVLRATFLCQIWSHTIQPLMLLL